MTQDRFAPEVVAERVRRNIAERGLPRALAGAYSDPGAYTPRGDNYEEPIHEWATRAIGIVLDHVQADQGETWYTVARRDKNGDWQNDWDGDFFADLEQAKGELQNASSPGQPYADLGWKLLEIREVTP